MDRLQRHHYKLPKQTARKQKQRAVRQKERDATPSTTHQGHSPARPRHLPEARRSQGPGVPLQASRGRAVRASICLIRLIFPCWLERGCIILGQIFALSPRAQARAGEKTRRPVSARPKNRRAAARQDFRGPTPRKRGLVGGGGRAA